MRNVRELSRENILNSKISQMPTNSTPGLKMLKKASKIFKNLFFNNGMLKFRSEALIGSIQI